MRTIGFWVYVFILIAALFWGYLFNLENDIAVPVVIFGISLPEYSLGVWLLVFCLAGLLAGITISLLPNLRHKRKVSVLLRQNRQLEQEVQLLRSQSLRD
ncbi:LapA family protein [Gilvimarinus sp. SDUM040013]|uniref:LapA family protein n=1 Tax=Gilvimarinus gilvus TaxID=3058038 RepID=A0ABU4RU43_9GAMM|nr:LapA family protein [Gilvimarinus sp. SDUM040013]MDO3385015.1 LapA family protein [Gilvimarinus sp. SDUM040013]MDX6848390.1 LapA family protein [Gilvimarinus sp. SDUM040013]